MENIFGSLKIAITTPFGFVRFSFIDHDGVILRDNPFHFPECKCDQDLNWIDTSFDDESGTHMNGHWECSVCGKVHDASDGSEYEDFYCER